MIMLLDALPLLEASELIFSSKDTYQLMRCLEETVFCNKKKNVSLDFFIIYLFVFYDDFLFYFIYLFILIGIF